MKRLGLIYNKMIHIIKKLPLSFTPQILASTYKIQGKNLCNSNTLHPLKF